jgi:hypothetical protein
VISEEYGWLSPEKRLENLGTVSNYTRLDVIGSWQDIVYEEKIAGDMYWFVVFFFSLRPPLGGGLGSADLTLWGNHVQAIWRRWTVLWEQYRCKQDLIHPS